jgi:acetyltransferase-like isoleucine patch superfamily enzyme
VSDTDWDGGIESPRGDRLYKLYGRSTRRVVRNQIRSRCIAEEGGEVRSITLRRIMRDYHGVTVGLYSDGGCFTPNAMDPDTTIGRYSSIAYTAAAFGANHPMNAKSTHAIFYNPALGETDVDLVERTKLTIGSDVWMGHNSIVLNGVESIGHGAVIGAGSVVHKDVPPYAVVVGHPARVVRYRFSDEIIEELLAEQWWERSFEDLKAEGLEKFQQPLEGDFLR